MGRSQQIKNALVAYMLPDLRLERSLAKPLVVITSEVTHCNTPKTNWSIQMKRFATTRLPQKHHCNLLAISRQYCLTIADKINAKPILNQQINNEIVRQLKVVNNKKNLTPLFPVSVASILLCTSATKTYLCSSLLRTLSCFFFQKCK